MGPWGVTYFHVYKSGRWLHAGHLTSKTPCPFHPRLVKLNVNIFAEHWEKCPACGKSGKRPPAVGGSPSLSSLCPVPTQVQDLGGEGTSPGPAACLPPHSGHSTSTPLSSATLSSRRQLPSKACPVHSHAEHAVHTVSLNPTRVSRSRGCPRGLVPELQLGDIS